MDKPTNRQAYLDWLRILAIIAVLFFHAASPFVAEWHWHIKNKETSHLLLEFNYWLHRFRMPLLFFISGTVSYFMLQRRSGGGFIGLRFRRLFIPFVFGMFVVVPPQVYLERLNQGYQGNYFSFYPSVFKLIPYPKGNTSWHHLWFILYLFIYDVVCAPFFVWLISQKGKIILQKLGWLARGKNIYLITLPSIIIYSSLSLRFPSTDDLIHDVAFFLYWPTFLVGGFICIANPRLMDSLEKNRRFSLTLAFLSLLGINYLRWNNYEPWHVLSNFRTNWLTYAYLALEVICAWSWVFTAVGYGKKYLDKRHKILSYANQAVYPFFILHQTVIVIIAYYVVQTSDTIGMKFVFTVIVSFALTIGMYHLFVRPYAITRLLFGMKSKKEVEKTDISVPVRTSQVAIEATS
ncbi:MAG: acyltransferase [Bacteroidetes bacterium]|nr:MAG: acyltransferase [Bacteroidota bacterium]